MNIIKNVAVALIGSASLLAASEAGAVPQLQLTINGGTYAGCPDETTCAPGAAFDLYALGTPGTKNPIDVVNGTFYLSIALIPPTSTGGNYGSFTINGTTIQVTSDMTYGIPPLPCTTPGCLATHSIYPTYFYQYAFTGFPDGPYNALDVQNLAFTSSMLVAGSDMYARMFSIDASGLAAGFGLHFDLYTAECLALITGGQDCNVDQFAPFSHDAQYSGDTDTDNDTDTDVPEPGTLALLGLGLIGIGAVRRRKA